MKKKRIDILTIYQPQACISASKKYISITKVENEEDKRLSKTEGNVNLTDYWLKQGRIIVNQDLSYTCQYIPLLSDEKICQDENVFDKKEDWWNDLEGRYVFIQFLKVFLDEGKVNYRTEDEIKGIKQNIIDKIDQDSTIDGMCFRTIDNADLIFILASDDEKYLKDFAQATVKELGERLFSCYSMKGKCRGQKDELIIEDEEAVEENNSINETSKRKLFDGWCIKISRVLKEDFQEFVDKKDKKMSAYYRVLLQTITVLAQYEQKKLLKDLFFIFYPPISLFIKQLDKAEKDVNNIKVKIEQVQLESKKEILVKEKYKKITEIETALSQFIDSVEELLYHIGHSCRDILSENGKGGMPFDIPIRLCMMYISYLGVLTNVLNDTKHEFQYCFYPVTYSRPVTQCISAGMSDDSSLIRIKVSKHTMFTPRSFLIILSHEVSHYVNRKCRQRRLRAVLFVEMITITLVNMLTQDLLEDNNSNAEYFLNKYIQTTQQRLSDYIRSELRSNLQKKKNNSVEEENIYQFSTLWESQKVMCAKLLYDSSGKLENAIDYLGKDIISKTQGEDQYKLLLSLYSLQEKIKNRRVLLLYNQKHMAFLELLENNLKEIYADISAIKILELSPSEYLEAYLISESYIPQEDDFEINVINRFAVVNKVMNESNEEWREEWREQWNQGDNKQGDRKDQSVNNFLQRLKEVVNGYTASLYPMENEPDSAGKEQEPLGGNLFYCKQIVDMEVSYLEECCKSFDTYLADIDSQKKKRLKGLRELFQCFKVYPKDKDISFEDFFARCDYLMAFYKEDVSKERNREIGLT